MTTEFKGRHIEVLTRIADYDSKLGLAIGAVRADGELVRAGLLIDRACTAELLIQGLEGLIQQLKSGLARKE